MQLVSVDDLCALVKKIGIDTVFNGIVAQLRADFMRWPVFDKSPRHAIRSNEGVLELMPTADEDYYAVKIVNGHPNNPKDKKLTVCGLGLLYDVRSGYPLLFSEMTLLTAFRTAAVSALASQVLARPGSKSLAMIGCGAQSEFQVCAHQVLCGIDTVYYTDIDVAAMEKFANNLADRGLTLIPVSNISSATESADIIISATACEHAQRLLTLDNCRPGVHINAIGGDSPGKTECDSALLEKAMVVVEYLPQTKIEGETQQLSAPPHAELWQIMVGERVGRRTDSDITVFDSVGFAIEDYATLRWLYDQYADKKLNNKVTWVPEVTDPKNIFSLLQG